MTPEHLEATARSERTYAKDRRESVESKRIHIRNAETYEEMARQMRQARENEETK